MTLVDALPFGDMKKTRGPEVGLVPYQPSPLTSRYPLEVGNPPSDQHLRRMHTSLKWNSQHHPHFCPAPAGLWVHSLLPGPADSFSFPPWVRGSWLEGMLREKPWIRYKLGADS